MADKKKSETKEEPKPTGVPPATGDTIDERMAALLKDHKRMGAR